MYASTSRPALCAAISAALTGVTAAVVGVIANLALYFAVHTLFSETRTIGGGPVEVLAPVWSSYIWEAFALSVLAGVLVFVLKWSVLRTLGVCALAGVLVNLL